MIVTRVNVRFMTMTILLEIARNNVVKALSDFRGNWRKLPNDEMQVLYRIFQDSLKEFDEEMSKLVEWRKENSS